MPCDAVPFDATGFQVHKSPQQARRSDWGTAAGDSAVFNNALQLRNHPEEHSERTRELKTRCAAVMDMTAEESNVNGEGNDGAQRGRLYFFLVLAVVMSSVYALFTYLIGFRPCRAIIGNFAVMCENTRVGVCILGIICVRRVSICPALLR